eukprot:7466560-Prorocentrum_lima.AAC.1
MSTPIRPNTRILAGCKQSVPWVRAYLYQLLQSLHTKHKPSTCTQTWVDDMRQRTVGKCQVAEKAAAAATDL